MAEHLHLKLPPVLKKHPAIIVGGVIGLLALVLILRSAGSSTPAVAGNASPDPNASLAAQTQIALASIGANTAGQSAQLNYATAQLGLSATNAQFGMQIQSEQDQHTADLSLAQVSAQVQNLQTSDQAQIDALQINTQATLQSHMSDNDLATVANNNLTSENINAVQTAGIVQLANIQTAGQVNIAGITANSNVSIAGINAQTQQLIASYSAGVATTESNNQTALGIVQSNNATTLGVNQAMFSYDATKVISDNLAGVATTESNNQTALGTTQSNNMTTLGTNQAMYSYQTAKVTSDNAASVAKKQSSNSLIGGIVGGVLGLFG